MSKQKDQQRQFTRELVINAPKEAVWKALSDAVEVCQWFAPEAVISGPVGGEVRWKWTNEIVWQQTITTWDVGERLVTTYDSEVDNGIGGKVPLFMDFQLQSNRDGSTTTLRLIHSGFGPEADFDSEYDGISHGWFIELRSLQLYLEKHLGQQRQLCWIQAEFGMGSDEAWQRLTGSNGLNCAAGLLNLQTGDRFNFTTADGDFFTGEVYKNTPHSFVGIVENWDYSFLRIEVETCSSTNQLWLWHATYGQDQNKVDAITYRWQTMVDRLFGKQSVNQSQSALQQVNL